MSSPEHRFERRGEGPPLLLMHGLGSSLRIWDPVRPLLEKRMDVIALDLPGHGGSPAPLPQASSPKALTLTVAAFLDRLGIQTAHLAGDSLGGWLALELAKIGRARSVTALSWAGLWRRRTPTYNVITFYTYRAIGSLIEVHASVPHQQSHHAHDLALAILWSTVGITTVCGNGGIERLCKRIRF